MANSPDEIKSHIKLYWVIGGALFLCTLLTVALNKIPFFDTGAPGVSPGDIVIGLAVAVFKSSLVALIFMHLNHERGLIYKVLLFTLAFSVSLMGLTLFAHADPIKPRAEYIGKSLPVEPEEGEHTETAQHH